MDPLSTIESFRRDACLSETAMSLALGKSPSYMQKLRYGHNAPSWPMAHKIREFMDQWSLGHRGRPFFAGLMADQFELALVKGRKPAPALEPTG